MDVERKDVFEFLVTLDESEFAKVKVMADKSTVSVETILEVGFENAIEEG